MNETYKFLQKTITRNWDNKTDEELCELYQKTNDNELISTIFCRNFSMWKRLLKKYGFFIETEEYPSIILETLDKAMKSYDAERKIAFTTLATTFVRNKLINMNRYYGIKKEVDRSAVSYDAILDTDDSTSYLDGLEDSTGADAISDICVELDMKYNMGLNRKELEVCNLILKNNSITKLEIAEELNKNRLTIYNYAKSIKEKFEADEEYLRGM